MKKSILISSALTAVTLPVVAVIACGETKKDYKIVSKWDTAPSYNGVKANKKLGVIVSDPENPRWQKSKDFFEKNGSNVFNGVLVNIKKKASEQTDWINTNQNNFDALIVGATDNSIAGTWESYSINKPVIAFDRLVKTNNRIAYNWYVTYDNSLVGKMQGIFILNKIYNQAWTETTSDADILTYVENNKLQSKKIILALAGDPADNNAELFYNGAMGLLKKVAGKDSNFVIPA